MQKFEFCVIITLMNSELFPIILIVCVVILTIVLSVASIFLISVLLEARRTLVRANAILEDTQDKVQAILNPFHSLSAFASHFTTGLKVVDGFVALLKDKNAKTDADQPAAKTKS